MGINFLVNQQQNNGSSLLATALPPTKSGEVYEGNPLLSIQSTGFAFADLNGDGIDDLLEATFLETPQIVKGYPFPQRAHLMDGDGTITGTIVLHQDPEGGRSVTSGQIYSDSPLPDVVFANAHRIMVLNRGALIAEGDAQSIRNDPRVQEVYLGGGTVFGTEEEASDA